MAAPRVEIDGSTGEGGGQVLRTSLTLSLLTGIPFQMVNIRARRPKPGLQPQHLQSVRAAAAVSAARVEGDHLGSRSLFFEPGPVVAGDYDFAIGTAGATGLVLQTVYLPLALRGGAGSTVSVSGGTHVPASPCFHFLAITWRAYLERLGLRLALTLRRPGFYPRGGGAIEAAIVPARRVEAFFVDDATVKKPGEITGFSAVAGLPEKIAERQAAQAIKRLRKAGLSSRIAVETWQGGPGTVVGLALHCTPVPTLFFGLGERGKPAERVADEAADALLEHLAAAPAAVDPHSADQIVLPLAFAGAASSFPVSIITSHLLTNIDMIRRFVACTIVCEGELGGPGRVKVASAGSRSSGG